MKIYRSHDGLFLGVCKGIEESLGIPAKYTRILIVLAAIVFRAWIILALYLLAALLMPLNTREDWRIQDNFETLSRDARRKAQEEYRDFMDTIKKTGNKEAPAEPDAPAETSADKDS